MQKKSLFQQLVIKNRGWSIQFIIYFYRKMSSEQSSFRQMYEFSQASRQPRRLRRTGKSNRGQRGNEQPNDPPRSTFLQLVQKAKNVAKFKQILKQRVAEKQSLNTHTLKPSELQFLENDSQRQQKKTFFAHNNKAVMAIEIVFIVTMLVYLWQCTFEIVFGHADFHYGVIGFSIGMYLVHIVFFNITQYGNEKLQLINDRHLIWEIYMKNKLIKDIVAISMMIVQLINLDQISMWLFIVCRIISLISYLQFRETGQKLQNLLSSSNQVESSLTIMKMVFNVILFLHFLSIALNLMVIVQNLNGNQDTWISAIHQDNSSSFNKYIVGWYWGATILSTVGFGEITPVNNFERFLISIVQIICCMTIGYFVNFVGSFIKVQAESSEKYEKQKRSLNRCMNIFTITHELKHKIRTHYFNKYIIETMHNANQEKDIIQNLTPSLKTALLQQSNFHILMRCNAIAKFSQETLQKITHVVKNVIFAPEHILYSRNVKDKKFWLINTGIIEEFTNNFQHSKLRKKIAIYNENQPVVGWINFLTQSPYRSMAKVKVFTVGQEIEEDSFMQVLKENVQDYHKFLQLKQKMIEKSRKFLPKCISCDRYTHNVINCPRIHFVRKDIKKLAMQSQHFDHFVDGLGKKKKIERPDISYNWKRSFGTGQLEKQAKMFTNSENRNSRSENATMDNFLKTFAIRDSILGFERRRVSIVSNRNTKKQSGTDFSIDPKQISNSSKSIKYLQAQVPEEIFQTVFFNKQNKDFMPDNDVEQVLSTYSKKSLKKLLLAHKDSHFTFKDIN